jgi:D-inositol-3-phosphate glycosyltransferase
MTSVAVLSLHTSPLTQPGTGDSGGMNVYVRELVSSLAQAGVRSEVFVRRWRSDLADVVDVEPGFRVVHVDAGAPDLSKEELPSIVDEFTDAVRHRLAHRFEADVIHANYWLSGQVGQELKRELSMPLVSTFHTLARVKADSGEALAAERAAVEAEVMCCSDVILASSQAEADDVRLHYGACPDRTEVVSPGVDHAFFAPGDRRGARAALGLGDEPILLYVGRIQPLKGLDVALCALRELAHTDATLVVVGGPSGPDGGAEVDHAHRIVAHEGLASRVRFVAPQPHHLLSTYYRAADVCVVPSRSESFGLVALEAAACGIPVVASAVGGLTTLVVDGETGLLVDERSPHAFAAAIDTVLGDAALAASMSARAAEHAGGYRWSVTSARLRRLYADLAARAPVGC